MTSLNIDPDQPTHKTTASAQGGLEQLRKRLLDLTRRNSLLNFRHSTKASLRVVDELPNELFTRLRDGNALTFKPILERELDRLKEKHNDVRALALETDGSADNSVVGSSHKASAKEVAAQLGIATSFDLPASTSDDNPRHFDRYIQTLHFPDELEAILRRINASARTALEESGTNMLYLIFGFLEWYESPDSSEPLLAPLVTIPVELTKNKPSRALGGIYEFMVEYTGDDLLTNLSLVEKLKRDFNLSVPMLEDDDTPESYFEKFADLLEGQPRWRIRRQITLSLLHFGKLLMFLDLDQSRNPGLLSHARVKELLEGPSHREVSSYGEVYELDQPDIAKELPHLIYDADSSQHSALLDALLGKNLVIEGPPGTGKSQTITNLIAAFLVKGKTVLFISEKLAALEVVRRRLDQAGLGDFCLELHSHKTRKDKLLLDIRQRIKHQRSYRPPDALDEKIRLLERQQKELVQYVQLINKPFGSLPKTIFNIIWNREALLQDHDFLHGLLDCLILSTADKLTATKEYDQRLQVDIYQQKLEALLVNSSSIADHPWSGIGNSKLNYVQEHEVFTKVEQLRACANTLVRDAQSLMAMVGLSSCISYSTLQRLCDVHLQLPHLSGAEEALLIPRLLLPEARTHARGLAERLLHHEKRMGKLRSEFTRIPLPDDQGIETAKAIVLELKRFDLEGKTRADLSSLLDSVREVYAELKCALSLFKQITESLGVGYSYTLQNLTCLGEALILLKETNLDILHLRHPILGNPTYDLIRNKAYSEAKLLQHLHAQLSHEYLMSRLPSALELWNHADTVSLSSFTQRLFNSQYRITRNFYRALRKDNCDSEWTVMATKLKELAEYRDKLERFSANTRYSEAFGGAFNGLETPFTEVTKLQSWYLELRKRLSPHGSIAQPITDALQNIPLERLRDAAAQTLSNESALHLLKTVPPKLDRLGINFAHSKNDSTQTELPHLLSELNKLNNLITQAIELLTSLSSPDHIRLRDIPHRLDELRTLQILEKELNQEAGSAELLGDYFRGCETDRAGLESTLDIIEKATHQDIPPEIQSWLLCSNEYPSRLQKLQTLLEPLDKELERYRALWFQFIEFVKLDFQQWYSNTPTEDWCNLSPETIQARFDKALNSPHDLAVWMDYARSRRELEDFQLTPLISLVEKGHLEATQLISAYDFAIYNSLLKLVLEAHPSLLNFSRSRHEKIRDQFVKLDKEILSLYRTQAAHEICQRQIPDGNARGPVREYTDRALIDHEMQKQRGHISIRALINRAHSALLGLKPCFMMGPMSVAQYLEPGKFHFDLVVMDEASQLKPEDALGAISRGSQIVIVGDPKQLPPTSFFDKLFQDNNENEADDSLAIEESESILDRACEVHQPIRQLRWHYRSRHESLIAFSNYQFYDQNLILFPSAQGKGSRLGLKFHFIKEGIYDSRINRPEADRIVQAILNHAATCPDESLGVATLNSSQRDLIEELLDSQTKFNPVMLAYKAKWDKTAEPFFIKNLETVQGDERDCIFISFTYGHDTRGNMYQRFGPINGSNGHRRLNVLFTRAKLRTEVFSSMQPEDILIDQGSSPGLKAMQGYLAYAKTGVLEQPQIGRGPEPNEFERAVSNALKMRGFDVKHQIGVAGYFIDLAVPHPKKQGGYVIGIECDGATYHSAKSARDRDRLRQSNLENLGWQIHRIWSTDWFRNSKAEINRIESLIHNLLRSEELRDS